MRVRSVARDQKRCVCATHPARDLRFCSSAALALLIPARLRGKRPVKRALEESRRFLSIIPSEVEGPGFFLRHLEPRLQEQRTLSADARRRGESGS